jgi:predicted transcriptional regulator YdeE
MMKFILTKLDTFLEAGIGIRTTNKEGQSQTDIGELWGKFMVDHLADQIPGKLSDDIYCVYTDYETDYNGAYTVILGCKVSSVAQLPGGFVDALVPGGKFMVFQPEGPLPESVAATWQDIWQSDIERAYTADFDMYYADPESRQTPVEIYVGIK